MKKILVMEDESNIRSFIVINLRRSGYEPIEAATGTEATGTKPAEQPADNGGVPAYVWVIVGVVAVAAIACAVILASKKKKK